MESNQLFEVIFLIFAVILVLGFPIFLISYVLYHVIQYQYWHNFRPIDPKIKRILQQQNIYYQNLNQKLKSQFERRVVLFIRSKDYIGRDGLEVHQEMKVLIASTAVQITFGFKFFQLPRFTKIYIYPKEYYSPVTQKRHKGEVFPMGKSISLSWNNFVKGISDPSDGINLGIHEMTHAMSLENKYLRNGVSGFMSPQSYRKWRVLAQEEISKIRQNETSIFRNYAATNIEEFLSVSLEVFFEQTEKFYQYNPKLYNATVQLLNQNPLNNSRRSISGKK